MGSFCVEFISSPDINGSIDPMDYISIDIDDTLMIVTSVEFSQNKFVVRGQSADYILTTRISDTVIENRNAEEAMRELVGNMSPFPLLELGESNGYTDKFTAQTSDQSIQEYCGIIARSVDMGYRVRKDGKRLLFECYKPGINTGGKFSAALGNLSGERYSVGVSNYANVAVVAGQGTGEDRVTVVAGDVGAQGADRREIYIDARNEQQSESETLEEYKARLVRYGEAKLKEHGKIQTSQFSLSGDGLRLGDLVYLTPTYSGKTVLARVASLSIKCQNNTTTRIAAVDISAASRK